MTSKEKKKSKKPKEFVEDYDQNRKIVEAIAARPENNYCFDCNAHAPRWASINFGVFLCLRCSGFHRNLGVHISKVRSVNLDKWTLEQVMLMDQIGNKRGAFLYEHRRPKQLRKPDEYTNDRTLEDYMRAKYEHKAFFAKPGDKEPGAEGDGSDSDSPVEAKKKEKKEKKEKREKTGKREKKEKTQPASDSDDDDDSPSRRRGRASPVSSSDSESEAARRRSERDDKADADNEFAGFGAAAGEQKAPPAPSRTADACAVAPPPSRPSRRGDDLQDEFMDFAPPKSGTPKTPGSEQPQAFKSLQDDVFALFESVSTK